MTITSGVGLISGLDIEDIVTQLMAIEARNKDHLNDRIDQIDEKRTAIIAIQARVMSIQLAATNFNKQSVFQQKAVSSTDENVLTATTNRFADPGIHRFTVARLASNHHLVSRNSFSSPNSNVGLGTISLEMGQGQVLRPTDLSFLNGQQGFQRGNITITDSQGNQAEIDLTTAVTITDVLDTINKNTTINVNASVSGDHLVLTDNAGGQGTLFVHDNDAAQSLGLTNLAATGTSYTGADLLSITADTRLMELNDGNGIRTTGINDIHFSLGVGGGIPLPGGDFSVSLKDTLQQVGDGTDSATQATSTTLRSLNSGAGVRLGKFRITDRNGEHVDIDLTELGDNPTLGQLKHKIETAAADNGMDIDVTFHGQDHITISDESSPVIGRTITGEVERTSDFIIEDLEGGHAADDLGIAGETSQSTIVGETIWQMETIGDVMAAINHHWANAAPDGNSMVTVAISAAGTGLEVSGMAPEIIVSPGDSEGAQSSAADDLGILGSVTGAPLTGRRLIAGLNTVMLRSLNGGSGNPDQRITSDGAISLSDRAGNTANLNFSLDPTSADYAFSLQDVIDRINNTEDLNIHAAINDVGNGITLTDTTQDPSGEHNLEIAGDWAQKLGIHVDAAQDLSSINSGNLQLQYVSDATLLTDLRQGQGIRLGSFSVTDRDGNSKTLDFSDPTAYQTVGDVIEGFLKSGTNLRARINDTGDGILVYDNLSSAGSDITIADVVGDTAKDLRILGSSEFGDNFIDGSYEFTLDVGGGDSIEEIVNEIDAAGIDIQGSLIKDSADHGGYRLSLSSLVAGAAGTIYLDPGATSLGTQTISRGQDALMFYGDKDQGGFLVTSSSNTVENLVKGATIELKSVSDDPVEITIADDVESIVAQMQSFVDAYNETMSDIADLTRFDPETLDRGLLFGDATIRSISRTLQSITYRTVAGIDGDVNQLSKVGITVARLGFQTETNDQGETVNYAVTTTPRLEFDEAKFREVFNDPELKDEVVELFTKAETGIGDYLADTLDRIAGSYDSTITGRLDGMDSQQRLLNGRIGQLDVLLQAKEARLYRQFYAMEQAIASMQSQQSALANLSSLTNL